MALLKTLAIASLQCSMPS
eukprot:Gb_34490 [translate_table: standard]